MKLVDLLNRQNRKTFALVCFIMVMALGGLDLYPGNISFAIFYLAPISTSAWFVGTSFSIILSGFVGLAVGLKKYDNELAQQTELILSFWTGCSAFLMFASHSYILSRLRKMYDIERQLSRKDWLTSLYNHYGFVEKTNEILEKTHSKPLFSLAYIDLDNFKKINDELGHAEGDKLLRLFAKTLSRSVRSSDLCARLGGDEFVVFFQKPNDEFVKDTVEKLNARLLKAMSKKDWPVTFSIGVVTFFAQPKSIDEAIQSADKLMYSSKRKGKNQVHYQVIDAVESSNNNLKVQTEDFSHHLK